MGKRETLKWPVRRAATQKFGVQTSETKGSADGRRPVRGPARRVGNADAARAAKLRKRAPQKLTRGSGVWGQSSVFPFQWLRQADL